MQRLTAGADRNLPASWVAVANTAMPGEYRLMLNEISTIGTAAGGSAGMNFAVTMTAAQRTSPSFFVTAATTGPNATRQVTTVNWPAMSQWNRNSLAGGLTAAEMFGIAPAPNFAVTFTTPAVAATATTGALAAHNWTPEQLGLTQPAPNNNVRTHLQLQRQAPGATAWTNVTDTSQAGTYRVEALIFNTNGVQLLATVPTRFSPQFVVTYSGITTPPTNAVTAVNWGTFTNLTGIGQLPQAILDTRPQVTVTVNNATTALSTLNLPATATTANRFMVAGATANTGQFTLQRLNDAGAWVNHTAAITAATTGVFRFVMQNFNSTSHVMNLPEAQRVSPTFTITAAGGTAPAQITAVRMLNAIGAQQFNGTTFLTLAEVVQNFMTNGRGGVEVQIGGTWFRVGTGVGQVNIAANLTFTMQRRNIGTGTTFVPATVVAAAGHYRLVMNNFSTPTHFMNLDVADRTSGAPGNRTGIDAEWTVNYAQIVLDIADGGFTRAYNGLYTFTPTISDFTINGMVAGFESVFVSTAGATVLFEDENAGATISYIAGFTLIGAHAANYVIDWPSTITNIVGNGLINRAIATLTLTQSINDRIFDGTADATAYAMDRIVVGGVAGESLALNPTLTEILFDSANVGTRTLVMNTGSLIAGTGTNPGNPANYYIVQAGVDELWGLDPMPITIPFGVTAEITRATAEIVLQGSVEMLFNNTSVVPAGEISVQVLGEVVGGFRQTLNITGAQFRFSQTRIGAAAALVAGEWYIQLIGGTLANGTGPQAGLAANYNFDNGLAGGTPSQMAGAGGNALVPVTMGAHTATIVPREVTVELFANVGRPHIAGETAIAPGIITVGATGAVRVSTGIATMPTVALVGPAFEFSSSSPGDFHTLILTAGTLGVSDALAASLILPALPLNVENPNNFMVRITPPEGFGFIDIIGTAPNVEFSGTPLTPLAVMDMFTIERHNAATAVPNSDFVLQQLVGTNWVEVDSALNVGTFRLSVTHATLVEPAVSNSFQITPRGVTITGSLTRPFNDTNEFTVTSANVSIAGAFTPGLGIATVVATSTWSAGAGAGVGSGALTVPTLTLTGAGASNYEIISVAITGAITAVEIQVSLTGNVVTDPPATGYVIDSNDVSFIATDFAGNPVTITNPVFEVGRTTPGMTTLTLVGGTISVLGHTLTLPVVIDTTVFSVRIDGVVDLGNPNDPSSPNQLTFEGSVADREFGGTGAQAALARLDVINQMQLRLDGQPLPADFPQAQIILQRARHNADGTNSGVWASGVGGVGFMNTIEAGFYRLVIPVFSAGQWANTTEIVSEVFEVTRRQLTLVTGNVNLLNITRSYDGTVAVPAGWASAITFEGLVSGFETVGFEGTAVFQSPNVTAGGTRITASSVVLVAAGGTTHHLNYYIAGTQNNAGLVGHITPIRATLRLMMSFENTLDENDRQSTAINPQPIRGIHYELFGLNNAPLDFANATWALSTVGAAFNGGLRNLVITNAGELVSLQPGIVFASNYYMLDTVLVFNNSAETNGTQFRIVTVGGDMEAEVTWVMTGVADIIFGDTGAVMTAREVAQRLQIEYPAGSGNQVGSHVEGTGLGEVVEAAFAAGTTGIARLQRSTSGTENGPWADLALTDTTSIAGWYRLQISAFNVLGLNRTSMAVSHAFQIRPRELQIELIAPITRVFNDSPAIATALLNNQVRVFCDVAGVDALITTMVGANVEFAAAGVGTHEITATGLGANQIANANLGANATINFTLPITAVLGTGEITHANVSGAVLQSVRREMDAGLGSLALPTAGDIAIFGVGGVGINMTAPVFRFGVAGLTYADGSPRFEEASTPGIHDLWLVGGTVTGNENHLFSEANPVRLDAAPQIVIAIFNTQNLVPEFTAQAGWIFGTRTGAPLTQQQFMVNFQTVFNVAMDGTYMNANWIQSAHQIDIFTATSTVPGIHYGLPIARVEFRAPGTQNWVAHTGVIQNAGEYRMVLRPFQAGPGANDLRLTDLGEVRMTSPVMTITQAEVQLVHRDGPTGTITRPPVSFGNPAAAAPALFVGQLALSNPTVTAGIGIDVSNILAGFGSIIEGVRAPMWFDYGSIVLTGYGASNFIITGSDVSGLIERVVLSVVENPVPPVSPIFEVTFRGTNVFNAGTTRLSAFGSSVAGFGIAGLIAPGHDVDVIFNISTSSQNIGVHNLILTNFQAVGEHADGYIWNFPQSITIVGGARITPAVLTVEIIDNAVSRMYDGSSAVPQPQLGANYRFVGADGTNALGLFGADEVRAVFVGTLANANAGPARNVAVTFSGLEGSGASNYVLVAGSATLSVTITPRQYQAASTFPMGTFDRTFDGSQVARVEVVPASMLQHIVLPEVIRPLMIGATAEFSGVAAGQVTVTIRVNLGGNVNVAVAPLEVTATIHAATVRVYAPSVNLILGVDEMVLPAGYGFRTGEALRVGAGTPQSITNGINWTQQALITDFDAANPPTAVRTFEVRINRVGLTNANPNINFVFVDVDTRENGVQVNNSAIFVNSQHLNAGNVGGMGVVVERPGGGWEAGWSTNIERITRDDSVHFSGANHADLRNSEVFSVNFTGPVGAAAFSLARNVTVDPGAVVFVITLSESQRNMTTPMALVASSNGDISTQVLNVDANGVVRITASGNVQELLIFDYYNPSWLGTYWWILAMIGGIILLIAIVLVIVLLVMSSRRKTREQEMLERKQQQQAYPMMQPMLLGAGPQGNMLALPGAAATAHPGYGAAYGRPAARPAYQAQRKPAVRTQNGVKVGPNGRPIQEARVVQNRPGQPKPGQARPQGQPGPRPVPQGKHPQGHKANRPAPQKPQAPTGNGAGTPGTPGQKPPTV